MPDTPKSKSTSSLISKLRSKQYTKAVSQVLFATLVFAQAQQVIATDSGTNNKSGPLKQKNITPSDATIHPQPKAAQTLLLDIASNIEHLETSEQYMHTLLAVGQRGHILRSSDGGKAFERINSPTTHTLTSISFLSEKIVVAAGHHLTLIRSEDAGKTWQQISLNTKDTAPWLDVLSIDQTNILAVGAYGHFARSSDQGKTWEVGFPTEEDFHLNAIIRLSENQLFIAGEAGRAYYSNNLGETWLGLNPPYSGSFFSAHAVSPEKVLLLGLRGTALIGQLSSEQETWFWSTLPLNAKHSWFSVSTQPENNAVWLAGAAGQLARLELSPIKGFDYVSKPSAERASEQSPPKPNLSHVNRADRADISQVMYLKDQLWAVGQNGLKRYQVDLEASTPLATILISEKPYKFNP